MQSSSKTRLILGQLAVITAMMCLNGAAIPAAAQTLPASTVIGWGLDEFGETQSPDDGDFVAVAAGEFFSLALRADGSLAGWGFNQYGQTDVPEDDDFVAVAAGFAHGLAVRTDGSLAAWGGETNVPVGDDFVAVAAGGFHSLALRGDGSLAGWGGWNLFGETNVPAGNDFVAVAAGYFHSLALRADGSLAAWGSNWYGESVAPAGNDFVAIAAGYFHNLALRADGSLVGWGMNTDGQTDVPTGNDFVAVAAGFAHSLALRADGSLVGWGSNASGQTDVPEGNDFVAVAAGSAHSLAIRSASKPLAVEVATSATVLWPPNHAMLPVTISASVVQGFTSPENLLVGCWVTSNQPDDTQGNGRHIGDVAGRDGFTAPVPINLEHVGAGRYQATILLRAERDGKDKTGRVYSIRVEAWNPNGNSSSAACEVIVPHSQGKNPGK